MNKDHGVEVSSGDRFRFGHNWRNFLDRIDEERISRAELSLQEMLDCSSLSGKRFLDVGSGSGLFSLAARRMGAYVHSFDFDPQSVLTTELIRKRFGGDNEGWLVERGSVLDNEYVSTLGEWDVVYSWGVLHHTGDMWRSFDVVSRMVKKDGILFISIYNDQGVWSKVWRVIKRVYNKCPPWIRPIYLFLVMVPNQLKLLLIAALKGNPLGYFKNIRNYADTSTRGMSYWNDIVDWIGGYPFEVATPDAVFDYFRRKGFTLEKLVTWGSGASCNEYVFRKTSL